MNKPDGDPAFPTVQQFDERTGKYIAYANPGMSLRDYFAAQIIALATFTPGREDCTHGMDAALAYRVADAMLKARES